MVPHMFSNCYPMCSFSFSKGTYSPIHRVNQELSRHSFQLLYSQSGNCVLFLIRKIFGKAAQVTKKKQFSNLSKRWRKQHRQKKTNQPKLQRLFPKMLLDLMSSDPANHDTATLIAPSNYRVSDHHYLLPFKTFRVCSLPPTP